ncbi:META domain-containing protein [Zhengella sp. ZM62]|uniref:META domain-containing protein n=1 Tax=Zhengella sedimenti TaxID=3390035 RepID=UPI00397599ED
MTVVWSGDCKLFALSSPQVLSSVPASGPVDVMLAMVPATGAEGVPVRQITGIAWRVTEVLGAPWNGEDQATLVIDDDRNFSIFGGCNRLVGQQTLVGQDIVFPADFAGTLMACPDDAEARERQFLAALQRAAHSRALWRGAASA